MERNRPTGMAAFTLVWFGQIISLLGTSMAQFALIYWAYQKTGQATSLALMGLFSYGPVVLLSPVAGVLVDRLDRKLVLMLSDLASGLSSLLLLLLYHADALEIWHLYAAGAFAGAFQSIQFPAYSAAISTMIPREHYGRANGMIQMAESGSVILAPVLASLLLVSAGIGGILAIDLVTFAVAITTLLFVHIPRPQVTEAGRRGRGSLWKEVAYGFRYILERPSLLGLQLALFCSNLATGLVLAIQPAMILARTGNNATILASVSSIGAVGGVAGGLLMSLWGGPRNRVHGLLGGLFLNGICQLMLMGAGQSLPVWGAAAFAGSVLICVLNGSNQALWQAKVAPDVQGRVFATRRMIAQIAGPLTTAASGPLADRFFEPAMREGGALAPLFGGLVRPGPGAGIGLMFVLAGAFVSVSALTFYLFPAVRGAETILPDHDQMAAPAAESAT